MMVAATGSIDRTAQAIGVHPDTARRHYLDTKQAFDFAELFKKMATVLVPK
jgi:hypothetical protein